MGAAPAYRRQRARSHRGFFCLLAAFALALILPAAGSAQSAGGGICDRTPAVYAAILEKIENIDNCADVRLLHLRGIEGALDLSGLGLRELREGDFESLNNLEELYLRNNALVSLPEGLFDPLTDLEYLDLSGNHLASLPSGLFDDLRSLRVLRLNDNHLASLPAGLFDRVTSLTRLDLGENILASLPAGLFDRPRSLRQIDLTGNAFQSLPADLFDGLRGLERLWLSHNLLASLPAGLFDGLGALTTLSIDNNALTSLPSGLFNGLNSLRHLDLHENELAHLPWAIFRGLSPELLRLDANRFQRLPRGIFRDMTFSRFESLDFGENPKDAPRLLSFTVTLEAETGPSGVRVRAQILEGVPSRTSLSMRVSGSLWTPVVPAGGTSVTTPWVPARKDPDNPDIQLDHDIELRAGTIIGKDRSTGVTIELDFISGLDFRVPAQTMSVSVYDPAVTLSVSPQVVDEDAGATTVTVTAQLDGNPLPEETEVAVALSVSGRSGVTLVPPESFVLSLSGATAAEKFTLTPSVDDGLFGGDGVVTVSGTHPSLPVTTSTVFVRDTFRARVSVSGGAGLTSRPGSSFSADEGASVTLTAASADALGAASFAWRQLPGDPVWVLAPEVATDRAELHLALPERSAPYTVRLSVTATHDPGAAPLIRSATRNVTIEVAAADAAPVIEQAVAMVGGDTTGTGTVRVPAGTQIVLRGRASDADPDQRLTVEWSGPGNVPLSRVDPDRPEAVTFTAPDEIDRYTFTFSADDDGLGVGEPAVTSEVVAQVAPEVSIRALSASVMEGSDAWFEVRASGAPSAALTVDIDLSGGEDFGVGPSSRAVIEAASTTALLSVPTWYNRREADGVLRAELRAELRAATDYFVVAPAFAEMAIRDIGDPPVREVSIAAQASSVSEGSDAVFVLTANEAPLVAFTVGVELSATGAFGVATGTRMVAFEARALTGTLKVRTLDDHQEEADGVLRAELRAGTGYAVGAPAFAEMAIRDIGEPSPDVNLDESVDAKDALILYYTYSLRGDVGAGR